jgi:hypothetical protein
VAYQVGWFVQSANIAVIFFRMQVTVLVLATVMGITIVYVDSNIEFIARKMKNVQITIKLLALVILAW